MTTPVPLFGLDFYALKNLISLIGATLLPFVLFALMAVPIEQILKAVVKLLP
jgi:hypothetical protein